MMIFSDTKMAICIIISVACFSLVAGMIIGSDITTEAAQDFIAANAGKDHIIYAKGHYYNITEVNISMYNHKT